MNALYELFELSKEHPLAPETEDGVTVYIEEYGKTCFQVSGQFDRPSEYLQSLLDLIRVNFEPFPLGTLLLNANLGDVYERIPETPFQLGYLSLTSQTTKPFRAFWEEEVLPYLEQCGYSINEARVIYAIASTGEERYGLDFVDEVMQTLKSGYSLDEAVALMASQLNDSVDAPTKDVYSGCCLDTALNNRTRLSLWLFIDHPSFTIQ